MLVYLRMYYEFWQYFETLDVDNDRRVSEVEFIRGLPMMSSWGVIITNPKDTFKEILTKHREVAHITFTDFCDWIIGEHLKHHGDSYSH